MGSRKNELYENHAPLDKHDYRTFTSIDVTFISVNPRRFFQEAPVSYLPLKFGLRFSMKAWKASIKSSEGITVACFCAA